MFSNQLDNLEQENQNKAKVESLKIEEDFDFLFICGFNPKQMMNINNFYFKEMSDVYSLIPTGIVETMTLCYENTHIVGLPSIRAHSFRFNNFTRISFDIKFMNYVLYDHNYLLILENFIKEFRNKFQYIKNNNNPCSRCIFGNTSILTGKCSEIYIEKEQCQ